MYFARHGTAWIGQQLSHLRDLPKLSPLCSLNAYEISDSLFVESIGVIDKHVRKEIGSPALPEITRVVPAPSGGLGEDMAFIMRALKDSTVPPLPDGCTHHFFIGSNFLHRIYIQKQKFQN